MTLLLEKNQGVVQVAFILKLWPYFLFQTKTIMWFFFPCFRPETTAVLMTIIKNTVCHVRPSRFQREQKPCQISHSVSEQNNWELKNQCPSKGLHIPILLVIACPVIGWGLKWSVRGKIMEIMWWWHICFCFSLNWFSKKLHWKWMLKIINVIVKTKMRNNNNLFW